MIKDILLKLSVRKSRDVVCEYAISVAMLFDVQLSAIAFADVFPVTGPMLEGVNPSVIDAYCADRKAEADRAGQEFDDRTRTAGIKADSRVIIDDLGDAAHLFSEIARNYHISVVPQAD